MDTSKEYLLVQVGKVQKQRECSLEFTAFIHHGPCNKGWHFFPVVPDLAYIMYYPYQLS